MVRLKPSTLRRSTTTAVLILLIQWTTTALAENDELLPVLIAGPDRPWCEVQSPECRFDEESFLLDNQEDADRTLFDLYLADEYRGLILVSFTETWFEIEEPGDAVDQLPQLRDRAAVARLIKGRIAGSRTKPGVGTVRFSDRTFRVVVELAPEQLFRKALDPRGRLPSPESTFSFRQDVGIAHSGNFEDRRETAFSHRLLGGYSDWWAEAEGAALENAPYELNALALNTIVDDLQASGGLQRTRGQSFGGSVDFTGLSLESKPELYLDQESLRGSPLEIYIPSRARVEFFRGERLIGVQLLEFGLQEIDTSRFPHGAYEIDIVITENNGRVTRERRFFIKSGLLGLRDRPEWIAQAGLLRDKLELTGLPVYQLGVSTRLGSSLQGELSTYGTEGLHLGYMGVTALVSNMYLRGGFSASTEGHTGVSSYLGGTLLGLSISASYQATLDADEEDERRLSVIEQIELEREKDTEERLLDQLNNIARKREELTATIARRFGPAEVQLFGSISERGTQPRRYAYGPRVQVILYRKRRHDVQLDLAYFNTERGDDATALVRYRYLFYPWTLENEVSTRQGGRDSDENVFLSALGYDNVDRTGRGTRGSVSGSLINQQDAEEEVSTITSAGLQHVNSFADVDGFMNSVEFDKAKEVAWGINGRTSFVLGGGENMSLSYPARMDGGMLVEIASSTSQQEMEVLVNGQVYTRVPAGSQVLVGLAPFDIYELSIRPADSSEMVSYDAETHRAVIFPGTIAYHQWWVERVFIGLGRIVDPSGKPISYKRLRGFRGYVVTEEDGSFQAETTGDETISIESDEMRCSVKLPAVSKPPYFYEYGDLICNPDRNDD